MKALVVNLFGGPGSGKSTGAAYIFSRLKMDGINAELVTECAKDMVWEENYNALSYQPYVFGIQAYRIERCADKVDVIVTDSPSILSIIYNKNEKISESLNNLVMDNFNNYNNVSYFLERTKPYCEIGRTQTESESDDLSRSILGVLDEYNIPYSRVTGDLDGYSRIINDIKERLV